MANALQRVLRAHQWVYEKTGGPALVRESDAAAPHDGPKNRASRTNALTYGRDGDAYLVVASNGGADKAPGWLANLRANPNGEIQVGRRRCDVTARPTLPDYSRRWAIVNAVNKDRYTAYQKRTSRPIPIVELRPTS